SVEKRSGNDGAVAEDQQHRCEGGRTPSEGQITHHQDDDRQSQQEAVHRPPAETEIGLGDFSLTAGPATRLPDAHPSSSSLLGGNTKDRSSRAGAIQPRPSAIPVP